VVSFIATSVFVNGFSLQEYVEYVNMDDLLDQYPEGRMDGFDEPERGYDRDEIGFRDTETGEEFYVLKVAPVAKSLSSTCRLIQVT
jgi:hypothetical protein